MLIAVVVMVQRRGMGSGGDGNDGGGHKGGGGSDGNDGDGGQVAVMVGWWW